MSNLPTGTVTILVAEGRRVMRLRDKLPRAVFDRLLTDYGRLLRGVLDGTGGCDVNVIADETIATQGDVRLILFFGPLLADHLRGVVVDASACEGFELAAVQAKQPARDVTHVPVEETLAVARLHVTVRGRIEERGTVEELISQQLQRKPPNRRLLAIAGLRIDSDLESADAYAPKNA